jgi:Papain family cysteine protease
MPIYKGTTQCKLQTSSGAGADDFCKLSPNETAPDGAPIVKMKRVVWTAGSEESVREAVAKQGPLSIGIDANCIPFRFYTSGVLNTTECTTDPENIDHAVLLVGYGTAAGSRRCNVCIAVVCALQAMCCCPKPGAIT